ncbi:MAG: AraC family transcriptional regulator [Steroidobacteraceae bacterium]|nr:AraC family transcriptional regulator [Steroidobacteraceae bacterium]
MSRLRDHHVPDDAPAGRSRGRRGAIPREHLAPAPDDVVAQAAGAISNLLDLAATDKSLTEVDHSTVFGRADSPGLAGATGERAATRLGVRHFVPERMGAGYWDFFRPLPHVMLSITDARYRALQWAAVQGEDILKIRLLCSGRFLTPGRELLMEAPGLYASFHPRGRDGGYFMDAGVDTRVVIVHAWPEAFHGALGLARADLPRALTPAGLAAEPPYRHVGPLAPALFEAATGLIRSRAELSGALRHNFVEAKCRELLALVLNEMSNAELNARLGQHISTRDRHRISEACDYLAAHFRAPPPIAVLARRVGMNQTKLKAAFRHVTGRTIYEYVQELRMRKASALLSSGDASIGEVAYAVGYAHPANFTAAFKKHFGFLPRALKPRRT